VLARRGRGEAGKVFRFASHFWLVTLAAAMRNRKLLFHIYILVQRGEPSCSLSSAQRIQDLV
jgi:hypothetical protein